MKKIKLALVDDHDGFRKAITRLIQLEDDLKVVLQAENGVQLLELLKTTTVEVILMDIRMPKMDGFEASAQVKRLHPNIKIIAFSQYDIEANIVEMYIRGVRSFVGKEDKPEELFKAIRTIWNGGVYMTDHSSQIIQQYLTKFQISKSPSLNDFETGLLKLVCKGNSSSEIGRTLNKSHRTIEEHRENLYKKFGVRSKEELIAVAIKNKIVQ